MDASLPRPKLIIMATIHKKITIDGNDFCESTRIEVEKSSEENLLANKLRLEQTITEINDRLAVFK